MKQEKEPKILKEIFNGFMRLHILYHTANRPFYGQELKDELEEHGYHISYGTLYPLLSCLEDDGYLSRKDANAGGKIRKYYKITDTGLLVLNEAKLKLAELTKEVLEDD